MSEQEYKALVIAAFDKKLIKRLLPPELVSPTPGGLKNVLTKKCERGLTIHDEIILQSFLGQRANIVAYTAAAKVVNADVFRPLNNFLKDRTVSTALKNIELLAILIDFNLRPFNAGLKQTNADEIKDSGFITAPVTYLKPVDLHRSFKTAPGKRFNKLIIVILVAVLAGGGILYFTKENKRSFNGEGCMIWEGNFYRPVACNNENLHYKHTFNMNLFKNFEKITRADTLTPNSIGKVWYIKYKGNIEFFKAPGPYPTDTNRRVLPLTSHILNKYVYHVEN